MLQNFKIQASQTGQASATDYTGALVKHAVNTQISGIEAVVTASDGSHTAGIAGELDASSAITGCTVTAIGTAAAGTVYKNFGGIAGTNRGTISNCTFTLGAGNYNISHFGGIAASLYGTVENCSAQMKAASVTGLAAEDSAYIGGIAGATDYGVVRNCTAVMDFSASASGVTALGGIVGQMNGGTVSGCSATGSIAGEYCVGGIVGLTLGHAVSDSLIENCSADMKLEVTDMGGGIIGQARTLGSVTIRNCSASGTVNGFNSIGGLVGSIHYYGEGTPENPNAFTMDNCQSYVRSVTSTQLGAGAAAVSGGTAQSANAGGAIGFVTMGEADYLYCSTTITNCSAYTDVTASSSAVGGFTGYHVAREAAKSGNQYVYSNCYAYGNVTVSDGVGLQDYGNDNNGAAGGFIGAFASLSRNMRIYNCHAYGSAASSSTGAYGNCHIGGFLGYSYGTTEHISNTLLDSCTASGSATGAGGVGGFAGRTDRLTVKNCTSTGNALLRNGWASGGFIGVAFGTAISDCVARGTVTQLDPETTTAGYSIGGFVGEMMSMGDSVFDRCTAFGSVEGTGYVGGFLGVLHSFSANDIITFTRCVAYGSVSDLSDRGGSIIIGRGFGGFVGATLDLLSSVSYSGCSAYGDVYGHSVGGFSGYSLVRGTQSFVNCNAYGNATDPYPTGEAGGFTGWARGAVLIANNCHAYGNASSLEDSGGFFGPLAAVGTVTDCSAHATRIVGNANFSGEFSSLFGDNESNANGTRFVRCYYQYQTNAGWPFARGWGHTMDFATTTQTDSGIGNPENPNYVEEPFFTAAVANVSGDIQITFSGFTNIPAGVSVTDFTLSTDGGRTFTEFMYNGRTLVDIFIGSALLPVGSRIAVTAALSMQYTYHLPASSYPAAGRIRVQLTLSNGFSITTTV